MNHPISSGEFERAMQALERQINSGFSGVDRRLARIERASVPLAERVAVLEAYKKNVTKKHVGWSTVLVTGLTVLMEGVRRVFLGG